MVDPNPRTKVAPLTAVLSMRRAWAVVVPAVLCVACAGQPEGPLVTPPMALGTAPQVQLAAAGVPPATSRSEQLASSGYIEQEWRLQGQARVYAPANDWARDGRWSLREAEAPRPYATRLLLRRPSDPSRFNGVVVVEWLNTTLGFDLDGGWILTRDELMREGYAWVGVSAEASGNDGLTEVQAQRYATQDIASNAMAYDIFTQAGQVLRQQGSTLLGTQGTVTLLALGFSQSAVYLTTYINAFQPLTQAYSGFMLHGSAPAGAPVVAGRVGLLMPRIRSDLHTPVMQVQSEMEVAVSWPLSDTADTASVRYWEVAGAAHFDRRLQDEALPVAQARFRDQPLACLRPLNDLPIQVVDHAALHALRTWVRDGTAPPIVPRMARNALGFVRSDADGNAIGGWRLPEIDAPRAQYGTYSNIATSGISVSGLYRCIAGGSTIAFTPEQLLRRYGSQAAWLQRYQDAADALLKAGLMRPADHAEAIQRARRQAWPAASTASPAASAAIGH
jgi:hypothetical protein